MYAAATVTLLLWPPGGISYCGMSLARFPITTGQVDREQIFYCMSRGISRKEAMHMIVEGFFQRVYDRIPVEVVRETLSRTVQSKLGIETVVV